MDGEIILTRDRSSGRVHKRLRQGDRLMVDERCQTDQSGAFEVIEAPPVTEPGMLCLFCFPGEEDDVAWP